jgi:hypothetical protein
MSLRDFTGLQRAHLVKTWQQLIQL